MQQIIRDHATPLAAVPTEVEPRLHRLPGVRGVVFDIYGTLLISGCGDVGTTAIDARPTAFTAALQALGLTADITSAEGVQRLNTAIAEAHQSAHDDGIDHLEIDIREIWREVLDRLRDENSLRGETIDRPDIEQLTLEYELRVNPVWPMPGCAVTLDRLRSQGVTLGIISNAQFYTPLLFPALLDRSLSQLGFDPELCVYSFAHRRGKPGLHLYETSVRAFASRGYAPQELLYVGNDMLKDVWPAQQVGFRTALFAGDARSLRMRADDDRMRGVTPDVVLTALPQVIECV